MRHWAFTLDAARSIVRAKAMNDDFKMVAALIVVAIVISAIIELLKLSKEPKAESAYINLAALPAGSIIVLPKGTE